MELEYQTMTIPSESIIKYLVFSQKIEPHLKRTVIDREIPALAEDEGVSVTDDQVQEIADGYRKSLGLYDAEETRSFLDQYDLSIEDFSEFCERRALEEQMKQELFDEEDIKQYFVNHRSEFDRVAMAVIDLERESMAKELKMQIRNEDRDFYALAREHSVHSSRFKGGALGLVGRDEVEDALEGKIFNADPGDLVGPVSIGEKFRLILIEDKHTPELDEELKEVIRGRLFNRKVSERLGG